MNDIYAAFFAALFAVRKNGEVLTRCIEPKNIQFQKKIMKAHRRLRPYALLCDEPGLLPTVVCADRHRKHGSR